MPIYAIGDREPSISPGAYVHPDAVIIGDVIIGDKASVWPGSVLRGDHGSIRVGAQTSIQDGSVIHCTAELPTLIGARCVIGHMVHIEGATVEDDCLVGSGATLLHNVIVRSGGMVGAGAVVSPRTEVPSGALALGVPATIKPGRADPTLIEQAVRMYVHNVEWYRELRRLD